MPSRHYRNPSRRARIPNTPNLRIPELLVEINRVQCELEEAQRTLRLFEGKPIEIRSLAQAEYYEHLLEETLTRVRNREQELERIRLGGNNPSNLQMCSHGQSSIAGGSLANDAAHNMDRFLQRGHPQSVPECVPTSSMYSSMMNVAGRNIADQVQSTNRSNQVRTNEEFVQFDATASQWPEVKMGIEDSNVGSSVRN
ncbi:uncharacterized protein LOC18423661 [Amborella trichopoda]|uniref:uncharacterized protein LOC18423661 n=1 Tax=Amborella trichopoda TaxID=13333 RepID=UPI0009BFD61D|nr:uncharacterized protein LOC18423661 [Amborella trichopoda]|eukprot:XP_020530646.1 uncharacterized protein LOC18423661 [Amborella trichopoda]